MERIEIISAYTHECIGYFGDTPAEKQRCTKALSKVNICEILKQENVRVIYVQAISLPEID